VLFASPEGAPSDAVLAVLATLDRPVAAVTSEEAATAWLRIHPVELVIVNLNNGDFRAALRGRFGTTLAQLSVIGTQVLALTPPVDADVIHDVLDRLAGVNLLGVAENDVVDPFELSITVEKILTGDVFGLERYLAPAASVTTRQIRGSAEKAAMLAEIERFAQGTGIHPRAADSLVIAADEMIANAIYDAPADARGGRTR
jgi:hypothetical protein